MGTCHGAKELDAGDALHGGYVAASALIRLTVTLLRYTL
jgi:hypothetical protein